MEQLELKARVTSLSELGLQMTSTAISSSGVANNSGCIPSPLHSWEHVPGIMMVTLRLVSKILDHVELCLSPF